MLPPGHFNPQNLSANVIGSRITHNSFSHRPFAKLLRNRWGEGVNLDRQGDDRYDAPVSRPMTHLQQCLDR